jgi:hypothetical protein
MAKRRFFSRLASDEITSGYRTLTFTKFTTIMIVMLIVMSDLGFSSYYMVLGVEWFGHGFGLAFVDHTL